MTETVFSEREYLLDLLKTAMRANGIIGPYRYVRASELFGRRVRSYDALSNKEIRELTAHVDGVEVRR